MADESVRLNKYISEAGVCSRREADRLIEQGEVTIDGVTALVGQRVRPGQAVAVNGRLIAPEEEKVYLAVNKPVGIVCTAEKREKKNLIRFLNYPKKITYLGRLDKDSCGLLLMSNDGELNDRLMRARNRHEKEYIVEVDRPLTEDFIRSMRAGVYLSELDVTTRKCKVKKEAENSFRIILTQGLNRQIRRMCAELGYEVISLKRIRIMNIYLGDLKEGTYRDLTDEEVRTLKESVNRS